MPKRSSLMNVMTAAAEKTGRALIRDFGETEQLQVSRKGPADFVTQADLKAEKILKEELAKGRPKFAFLMEESGASGTSPSGERWIVDPIDGTTNFLHGLPHWAISIAAEAKGELIAAVIHDPIKNELFWAEKGQGAYVNDRRLRVSGRRRMEDCIFATGIPFKGRGDHGVFLGELARVMEVSAGVRRYGSAALDLAYVAAGRYDGFWERDLSPWDVAAGILIVREAGGVVSRIDGKRDDLLEAGDILTASADLHPALMKLLKG